jgi:hypothetical protein
VSVTTLIVAVRTSGAAGLVRLGAGFTALHARAQSAAQSVSTSFGPQMSRTFGQLNTQVRSLGNTLTRSFRRFVVGSRRDWEQFLSRLGDAAGEVFSSFSKWGAISAIVIAAIPAIIDLSGLVALLPPAILAAAASLLVLKLAFTGVGGAITAAIAGGDKWKQWEKAHKGFDKGAHDFAFAVGIVAKSWKQLQKAVQTSFFRDLGRELVLLNTAYLPTLSRWLPMISGEFGSMLHFLADWLRQPAQVAQIEGIFRNLSEVIHNLLRTMQPLVQIFLDIASVAAPRLADMTSNFAGAVERLAGHIRALRDNGKLGEWVDRARQQFGVLRDIISDLGGIISVFYQGASADGKTFLEQIQAQTQALNEWMHSADGQNLAEGIAAVGYALLAVGEILGALTGFFKTAFAGMIIIALSAFDLLLQGAAKAFGWIPGIGPKLRQASAEFDDYAQRVNSALAGIDDQDRTVKFTYLVDAKIEPAARPYAGINALSTVKHVSGVQFRARGGPVRAGQPYVVGEHAPELFIPDRNGRIATGGGGTAMGGGGGMQPQLTLGGSRGVGLAAVFRKWLDDELHSGRIRYQMVNGRLKPV